MARHFLSKMQQSKAMVFKFSFNVSLSSSHMIMKIYIYSSFIFQIPGGDGSCAEHVPRHCSTQGRFFRKYFVMYFFLQLEVGPVQAYMHWALAACHPYLSTIIYNFPT